MGGPSNDRRKAVANEGLSGASSLTVRQSIAPIALVTLLFFLWGFAYGLLDVLNAKFQTALNITAAKAGGLQGYVIPMVRLESPRAELHSLSTSFQDEQDLT
jgi:hypothetical protein